MGSEVERRSVRGEKRGECADSFWSTRFNFPIHSSATCNFLSSLPFPTLLFLPFSPSLPPLLHLFHIYFCLPYAFSSLLQDRFTQDMQPHYIYSPREMTRWVRGIYEALRPLETLPVEGLVRIWAHEALRLFQDRLVHDEERVWTEEMVDMIALKHFPNIDRKVKRTFVNSSWILQNFLSF